MTATQTQKTVWPCLNYRDARAAIRFLVEAFGFEERCAYAADEARRSSSMPSCAGRKAAA